MTLVRLLKNYIGVESIDHLREAQPEPDQSIERSTFVFFDIETTGLRPDRGARITEIALLNRNTDELLWQQSKEAISDEKLAAQLPSVLKHLTSGVVVGHNLQFDLKFIAYETERLGFRGPSLLFIDTLGLARKLCNNTSGLKLSSLLEKFNISPEGQLHTAAVDARATRALFWKFINLGNIETLATAGMQRVDWSTF